MIQAERLLSLTVRTVMLSFSFYNAISVPSLATVSDEASTLAS